MSSPRTRSRVAADAAIPEITPIQQFIESLQKDDYKDGYFDTIRGNRVMQDKFRALYGAAKLSPNTPAAEEANLEKYAQLRLQYGPSRAMPNKEDCTHNTNIYLKKGCKKAEATLYYSMSDIRKETESDLKTLFRPVEPLQQTRIEDAMTRAGEKYATEIFSKANDVTIFPLLPGNAMPRIFVPLEDALGMAGIEARGKGDQHTADTYLGQANQVRTATL